MKKKVVSVREMGDRQQLDSSSSDAEIGCVAGSERRGSFPAKLVLRLDDRTN